MKYVEAPGRIPIATPGPIVFAAGGITGCPDWQAELRELLEDAPGVLLNPRREEFPMDKPDEAQRQIQWEWNGLRIADAILFWFAAETVQPIVLFELGAALERWYRMPGKPRALFIGAHRDYPRRQDVEIQAKLMFPHLQISNRLEHVAQRVKSYVVDYVQDRR